MDEKTTEQLVQALQKDDVKSFQALMETIQCGTFRLGRFPVLSVMYLLGCKKLLRVYESKFIKYNSWQPLSEPTFVANAFRQKAGKCLRLYLEEVVTPLEMLMILDKTSKVKKLFSLPHPTAPVKQRIRDIYYIKYGLGVKYEGDSIVLDRRPFTKAEKQKFALSAICLVLCLAILVGSPFVLNVFVPLTKNGDGALLVSRWKSIDFASNKAYCLTKDVTLSDFHAEEMNCSLDGGGHQITVEQEEAVFGAVNGLIKNVTFKTSGGVVIEKVSSGGALVQVSVVATVDKTLEKSSSLFLGTNCGYLQEVSLEASGKVSFDSNGSEESVDIVLGGIVATNGLEDKNADNSRTALDKCSAKLDLNLSGDVKANGCFGGIVGDNYAYVQYCETFGNVTSDTVDIAGVCGTNYAYVSYDVNQANLCQLSEKEGWNPIVAGVAVSNYGMVAGSKNLGEISCVANGENDATASVAGVVGRCGGQVRQCGNFGKISASGSLQLCVGGIAGEGYGSLQQCLSDGEISVSGRDVVAGGIFAQASTAKDEDENYYGAVISTCVSRAKITVSATENALVGGLCGLIGEVLSADGEYYAGRIVSSCFVGETVLEGTYRFGGIAGGAGMNFYQNNANYYITSGTPLVNLENNGVVAGTKAFGCTVEFVPNSETEKDDKILYDCLDKGADSLPLDEIQNSNLYRSIVAVFA